VLVNEGPARVRELQAAGARFDLDPDGDFKLGREAAHSRHRIVHARGDQTGAEVARALVTKVREASNIQVFETARVLDLLLLDDEDGRQCAGVRASLAGRAVEIVADATVLATGGCGQIYRYTTNPQVATGDGFAMAHRAGVRMADMEFVQFHPTALDTPENPLALVSEAVRGEGAILLNGRGQRFMPDRHRLAELAPRDVVAREIFREQQAHGRVFLDATKIRTPFPVRFPGIYALCQARGIDPVSEPIPVTGVHGANRLASNSLLEGLVFAERVARDLIATPEELPVPEGGHWDVPPLTDRGAAQVAADEIRLLMWEYASISRTASGLRRCLTALARIGERLTTGATEERNLHTTATLVAEAALLRKESRGGHFRSDFPKTRRKWQGRHITW
jgi:L-aspartate oxidase